MPKFDLSFYPSILGSILLGIGIALLMDFNQQRDDLDPGLGLRGAIAINLCGGAALYGWLILRDLQLLTLGGSFLYGPKILLIEVSLLKLRSFLNFE